MSFSFAKMPRTLDTAMFRRERFDDGPPIVLGWVIHLPRPVTPIEREWFQDRGFSFLDGGCCGEGEWRRPDRPDDFT